MGGESIKRLDEGDAFTDMRKWGKVNGEEYKKGTSDNPLTGEHQNFLGTEDVSDISGTSEDDEVSKNIFNVEEPIDLEEDLDTKAAWQGEEAVPGSGNTVSSEQDLSDYDSEKDVGSAPVLFGSSLIGKEPADNWTEGERARQPHDKGKKGIIKKKLKDKFKKILGIK